MGNDFLTGTVQAQRSLTCLGEGEDATILYSNRVRRRNYGENVKVKKSRDNELKKKTDQETPC